MSNLMSPEVDKLFSAMNKVQGGLKSIIPDSDVKTGAYKFDYASFDSIWALLREPNRENGLSVIHSLDVMEGRNYLITILGHTSGQWIKSYYPLNPVDNKSQTLGSCITYGKRYSLAALFSLVTNKDDDGNAADNTGFITGKKYTAPSQSDQEKFNPPQEYKKKEFTGFITEKQKNLWFHYFKEWPAYKEIIEKRYEGSIAKMPFSEMQRNLDHFATWKTNREGMMPKPTLPEEGLGDETCPF